MASGLIPDFGMLGLCVCFVLLEQTGFGSIGRGLWRVLLSFCLEFIVELLLHGCVGFSGF